ncbi:hypothetical protein DFS34DRAFT_34196 [Phlyctochytrium arcticum]|nr:hypothetical protein DFS34DRAFT_34196 [Phlyctochytrium arcticum]
MGKHHHSNKDTYFGGVAASAVTYNHSPHPYSNRSRNQNTHAGKKNYQNDTHLPRPTRITRQLAYYFSDQNYPQDKFLLSLAAANPGEWVNADEICRFAKMKAMGVSSAELIEFVRSEEGVEGVEAGTGQWEGWVRKRTGVGHIKNDKEGEEGQSERVDGNASISEASSQLPPHLAHAPPHLHAALAAFHQSHFAQRPAILFPPFTHTHHQTSQASFQSTTQPKPESTEVDEGTAYWNALCEPCRSYWTEQYAQGKVDDQESHTSTELNEGIKEEQREDDKETGQEPAKESLHVDQDMDVSIKPESNGVHSVPT